MKTYLVSEDALRQMLDALENDPVPLNAINNASVFLKQILAKEPAKWVGKYCTDECMLDLYSVEEENNDRRKDSGDCQQGGLRKPGRYPHP